MRYADDVAVFAELSLDNANPDDAAKIGRVADIEEGLCETFDAKVGRSFGDTLAPETRIVGSQSHRTPRLVFAVPLRSLVAIEEGGRWDGSAWVDGRTLAASEYLLTNRARDGYYGIDRVGGTWGGSVRVTGVWANQTIDDVPADVREAMTFLVTETYRQQQASPADEIGPDGMMVRPRNPWNYEQVKEAIRRHRIVQVLL